MTSLPPVLTNRCYKLVGGQSSLLFGSAAGFDRTFISLLERGVRSPALTVTGWRSTVGKAVDGSGTHRDAAGAPG